MKRKGYIYDRMADWTMIKEAERVSLKNKKHNRGFVNHERDWMKNLTEIQQMVIEHRMQTSDYRYMELISGQGKMRKIAKLHFHPSHIEHQLLVMAGYDEIDKSLIHHTYASRTGYGQHKGAKQLNDWVQKNYEEYPWYAQFDIRKYYENIPHKLIREELERRFKDKDFIDAFIEPVEKFAPGGVGIPLGIRPSQTFGNLALSSFDRYVKETLHCKYYIRYLDDIVILCHTKAECKRKARLIEQYLKGIGFDIHQPRIDQLENGMDFLGYVTYPQRGMFWRSDDKKHWLKARSKVTNKKRLRELDCAAWGYIIHGNKHCKRLYKKMNGIPFARLGIKPTGATDKNGKRIIDAQGMAMSMILNKRVEILDVVSGVETSYGKDRVALLVSVMGTEGKILLNAPCKYTIAEAWDKGVTRMATVFIDRGGKHYDMDLKQTEVLEVNHSLVEVNSKGEIVYSDTKETINF